MVEYLNINGKKHPIRISYYTLIKFKEETGIGFEDLSSLQKEAKDKDKSFDMSAFGMDEFEVYEVLLYYSLIAGLKGVDKKATLEFERDDMFNLLEECLVDFVSFIPKFFKKFEDMENIGEEDGVKKPLMGNRHQRHAQKKQNKKKPITQKNTE